MTKVDKQTYFSLTIKEKHILINKDDFEINNYIKIKKIKASLIDFKLPFDLSQGTQILKNYRTNLEYLEIIVNIKKLNKYFTHFSILPENNYFLLKGSIDNIEFVMKIAIIPNKKNLEFILLEQYILEVNILKKNNIIRKIFNRLIEQNIFIYYVNLLEYILLNVYPINGYKIPNYKNLLISSFTINNENIYIKFEKLKKLSQNTSKDRFDLYKSKNDIIKNVYNKNKKINFLKNILDENFDYVSTKMFIDFCEDGNKFIKYVDSIFLARDLDNDIIFMLAVKSKELGLKDIFYKSIEKLKKIDNKNILELTYKLLYDFEKNIKENINYKSDENLFILFKKEKEYKKALYHLEKILNTNKLNENKISFLEKGYYISKKLNNNEKFKYYQKELLKYYKNNMLFPDNNNYIKNIIKALYYNIDDRELLDKFYKIDLTKNKDYKKIIALHYKIIRHLKKKEYIIRIYKRIYMCAKINNDEKNIIKVLKKAKKQFLDNAYFNILYKHWNI